MAQNVKWVSFGMKEEGVSTSVHFFPYSGTISANYPVELSLTIFGSELETLNVRMEGALLSQPDGLEVEKVFPALLSGYSGLYGIEIELSCGHENVDLSTSVCLIELVCSNGSIRFEPKRDGDNSIASGTCFKTNDEESSIVALNSTKNEISSGFPSGLVKASKNSSKLPAFSVGEFKISPDYLHSGINQTISSGKIQAQKFDMRSANSNVTYYMVTRNECNSNPCEVTSL